MSLIFAWLTVIAAVVVVETAVAQQETFCIVLSGEQHSLAGRELRRVLYSATGKVPSIGGHELLRNSLDTAFVLGRLDELRPSLRAATHGMELGESPEAHVVWSTDETQGGSTRQQHVILLSGNTDGAVLHAVYTAAEKLFGVHFLLSGDVIPKLPADSRVPRARHSLSPRFTTRGLQPFHDFAVGPDWWSLDDFKMILTQQRRMKMNFIGFHSYPWGPSLDTRAASASKRVQQTRVDAQDAGDPLSGKAEPLAWVGSASDLNRDGTVRPSGAYPAFWRTTGDDGWGLAARNTSSYVAGAAQLFPRECYGSPIQQDICVPKSPEVCTYH